MDLKRAYNMLSQWYDYTIANPNNSMCPMLMSSPGVGKTSIIEKLAKEKGVNLQVLILSQANPTEVAGMCMPDPDGGHVTHIYDPSWVGQLKDGDILFLDEVLKAPQAVLNSCLTMVQSRIMASGTKLPNVAIISAANPNKGAQNYPDELKQRFIEVGIDFNFRDWWEYVQETIPYWKNVDCSDAEKLMGRYLPSCQSGMSSWNKFTPRDAYKYLAWTADEDKDEGWSLSKDSACLNFISVAYGAGIKDIYMDMREIASHNIKVANKKTARELTEDALLRYGVTNDNEVYPPISCWVEQHRDDSDQEWAASLVEQDWWSTIAGVLANVAIEEGE